MKPINLLSKQAGFTLIEVVIFIIVSSILMSVILLGATTALRGTPSVHRQWIAMQVARECMEWFLQQRRLNGYTALACPGTVTATACAAPTGYTVTNTMTCTTWNSDSAYKTITVTVSGLANASIAAQIGDY